MGWGSALRRRVRRMSPPLRLALAHGSIGFAVAGFAVAAIFAADFNGLGTLMRRAEAHPLPALLLWFFLGTGFSAVQIGVAVMQLGARPPAGPPEPRLRPVAVRARRG
jgi:hypothetical protein